MKTKRVLALIITVALLMTMFMSVSFASSPSDFTIVNGVLTKYTGTDSVVTIPDGVTGIGDAAFAGNTELTSVTIPNSVTNIGSDAFNCSGLTNITIPNSVSNIGIKAFFACTKLTAITIANGVTSIGSNAFSNCSELFAAQFLGNAPTMGSNVFSNCAAAFKVYYISGKTGFTNPWYGYVTVESFTTPTPTPTPVASFTDIGGHWATSYINSLAAKGVISGYEVSPGVFEFRADNSMKREEFAKIVTVAYNVYNSSATSAFSDCPVGAWFTPYVGSLQDEGLTTGLGDGTYGVGLNMSRQDTATMLSRAMVKYQAISIPDVAAADTIVSTFADVADMASYAKPPVAFFVNAKIIKGYETFAGSGTYEFRPKANITRAEISKIMVMSLDYVSV